MIAIVFCGVDTLPSLHLRGLSGDQKMRKINPMGCLSGGRKPCGNRGDFPRGAWAPHELAQLFDALSKSPTGQGSFI